MGPQRPTLRYRRHDGGRRGHDASTWTRPKLLAVLAGAAVAVVCLLLGLVLAVYLTLRPAPQADAPGDASRTGRTGTQSAPLAGTERADALANRPMRTADLTAAQPGPISTRDPGTIELPPPTRTGPAGVPTGYPHTPAGALAQLAGIDQTALQSGSLTGVRAVITGWAAPGGPTTRSWSAVAAMASFLDAAQLSGGGSAQLTLVVTPLMGMIKGTAGPDFVVVCVDFEVDATLASTQRIATADCQRMVWARGRWIIGPGSEPADPPSIWPDTDQAIDAGYQDLRRA